MDQVLRTRDGHAVTERAPQPTGWSLRAVLIFTHRWAGLTIAFFLVVVGLTGAALPFSTSLNHMFAPALWAVAPPTPGAQPMSGVALMKSVEAQTGGVVRYMPLQLDPHFAQAVFLGAQRGRTALGYDEVIADPYSGMIRQRVKSGRLSDGPVNFMPFIMKIHYSLAAGPAGTAVVGVASLVWVLVCLIGLYLTLPPKPPALSSTTPSWASRWAPAWMVRTRAGFQPLVYDTHRAGGVWLWPVLLVFAWSGVAFNLSSVQQPVSRFFGGQGLYAAPRNTDPGEGETMSMQAAVARGRVLMGEQAALRHFTIERDFALTLNPRTHAIGYYARTSLDRPVETTGSTLVWFDAVDGRLLEFKPPFGNTAADSFDKWTRELHVAGVGGLPYRLFVSAVGLATAILSATGVILWTRRQIRRLA